MLIPFWPCMVVVLRALQVLRVRRGPRGPRVQGEEGGEEVGEEAGKGNSHEMWDPLDTLLLHRRRSGTFGPRRHVQVSRFRHPPIIVIKKSISVLLWCVSFPPAVVEELPGRKTTAPATPAADPAATAAKEEEEEEEVDWDAMR